MKKKLTKNQILTKQENIEKMIAKILDQENILAERKAKLLEDYRNLQTLLEQKENPSKKDDPEVRKEEEISEKSKKEAKQLLEEFLKK